MKDGPRHEFIGRQQINENAAARTVELLDGADQKSLIELIRTAQVHNMHGIDMLTIGSAVESYSIVAAL